MKDLSNIQYKIGLLKLGITQRQLAKQLGVTESYISMLLAGKRKNEQFNNWILNNISLKRGSKTLWQLKKKYYLILKKFAV